MSAPAGWYEDPQNPQQIRYFDGRDWTTQTGPRTGPGSTPGQQTGYGTGTSAQSGYGTGTPGAQAWQGQAQQFQNPQPSSGQAHQPASPTAGFQFGGAQEVPREDRPQTQTHKSVVFMILGALAGILLLFGLGAVLSNDGLSASDLGIKSDFDCDDLADEWSTLTVSDPDDVKLVSASDMVEKENAIGTVELPEKGKTATVLECTGTGQFADGSSGPLHLKLDVRSSGALYISDVG